ncbi:MAG: competence/damage-inducible protein A [Planctomycetota bacterium]
MNEQNTKVRAALLTIGDELLLGEILDTNRLYLAQQLLPLGITVVCADTVGDEIADIVDAFKRALSRADIVLATGGLGPTADDLTMEALAKVFGVDLVFHPEVMEQIAQRFNRPISELPPSNRKQAWVPRGARVLRNDFGTAPGVHYPTSAGQHVFLMPGVPREMKGLLAEHVLPFLRERFPSNHVIVIKTLHCFGIGESVLGERVKDLMQPGRNPDVGTRVNAGVVTLRLVARGATEAEAQATLQPALAIAREALKDGLFGTDDETLSSATLKALVSRRKTVAIAESCTAGLVAALLTDTPGSSAALLEGAVVYSNAAKIRACGVKPETIAAYGAVSAETARELAVGIRERAGADIGVSVTGIAGPDGGTAVKPVGLVYFGVATANGAQTFERRLPGRDRAMIRERAAMQALDLIRRAALED